MTIASLLQSVPYSTQGASEQVVLAVYGSRPKQGSTSVVHSIHSTLSDNVLRQMRQPFEASCIIAFGIDHHVQWSPGASGDAVVAKKHLVHCHGTRLQKCTVSLGSKACHVIDNQNKGLHT